jgi:purine-nucleoside phosphorylase
MASELMQQLTETTSFIKSIYAGTPEVGIILGSGLGNLVKEMQVKQGN